MALSVHRPIRTLEDAVVVIAPPVHVPLFPSALISPNAPHRAVGAIQAGGHELATEDEDEDGNHPLPQIRLLRVFMISGAAGATTEPTMTDHPIFSTTFILDSGAIRHATGNRDLFPWLFQVQQGGEVQAANGHVLAIRGVGPVVMENFRVNKVLYVPGLACNVISLSMLIKLDYKPEFFPAGCLIKDRRTGKEVGNARLVRGLYHFDRLEIPLDRAPARAP